MCYLLLRRWFALYACHSYGKQPSSTEWRGLKFCVCIFGDPSMWNLCGFLWRVSVVLIPLSEGRGRLLLSHLGRRGNQRACGWLAAWDKGWMRLGCLARRGYRGDKRRSMRGGVLGSPTQPHSCMRGSSNTQTRPLYTRYKPSAPHPLVGRPSIFQSENAGFFQ